jgi:septal ring factor EnvC (AmiA/AmiB activator)
MEKNPELQAQIENIKAMQAALQEDIKALGKKEAEHELARKQLEQEKAEFQHQERGRRENLARLAAAKKAEEDAEAQRLAEEEAKKPKTVKVYVRTFKFDDETEQTVTSRAMDIMLATDKYGQKLNTHAQLIAVVDTVEYDPLEQ